jgi:hypothetical protein
MTLTESQAVDVDVFGCASSAAYQDDPKNDRNLKLAFDRADDVVAIAHGNHIASAHGHGWKDFDEMHANRGVRDATTAGDRLTIREFLNRRADIVVTLPRDCVD